MWPTGLLFLNPMTLRLNCVTIKCGCLSFVCSAVLICEFFFSFPQISVMIGFISFSEWPLFDKRPLKSFKIILGVDGSFVYLECLHYPLMKPCNTNASCALFLWRYSKLIVGLIKDLISSFWKLANPRPLKTAVFRKFTEVWDISNVSLRCLWQLLLMSKS